MRAWMASQLPRNDIEALVKLYTPNTMLLGTNSPTISEGRDAVRAYFTNLKLAGSGNKNDIQERNQRRIRHIRDGSAQPSIAADLAHRRERTRWAKERTRSRGNTLRVERSKWLGWR